MKKIFLLLICIIAFSGCEKPIYEQISAAEAYEIINKKDTIILDVREDFEYNQGNKTWYINGYDMGQFEKAIYGASLDYRLALTFNLGSVSIGATAFFPMDGNFEKLSPMPKWEETRVSLSVLFNIV